VQVEGNTMVHSLWNSNVGDLQGRRINALPFNSVVEQVDLYLEPLLSVTIVINNYHIFTAVTLKPDAD
jgi:hypothetical protein